MYIGRGSSRNTVTAIVVICSILCVGFMMFATAFLSFYFSICNTRFVEKSCINEGVARQIGITDSEMHNVIEKFITGLKKGYEPSVTVTKDSVSVEFFSDADKESILRTSNKIILFRRLSFAFIGVSIALFMIVLMESRAVVLRNTIAIAWVLILLFCGTLFIYMQMNPARFRDGFFTTVLLNGKPLQGWLGVMINHGMIKSAFLLELSFFLIVQLLFLIIVNGFSGHKKKERRR